MESSIYNLRRAGYKVRILYKRRFVYLHNGKPREVILSRHEAEECWGDDWRHHLQSGGGSVKVELRTPEGVEVWGESLCSKKDAFCKKFGRTLALLTAATQLFNPVNNSITQND